MNFSDGNITDFLERRNIDVRYDVNQRLQMHSSLIQRLSLEKELEGHQGCVNAVAWNSKGSLLISGSDDTRINIWSYPSHRFLHSIETGHSANIFCTKFVPETSDELVVSGAGDAEVRAFHLSRLSGRRPDENTIAPLALFQCHSKRVKKLAVEVGNPHVVWSASEDGTLRQHDLREGVSCPPARSSHQECRNVLLDLRSGAKRSLADPPKQCLFLKSCDIGTTRSHLLLVGGSDAFARLYDRRMLPTLSTCQQKQQPPPCVNYFCPMHLSDRGRPSLHLTHVTFSPNGEEVLLSYSGEHVYLMDVNPGDESFMKYTAEDVSNQISLPFVLRKTEVQPLAPLVLPNDYPRQSKFSARLKKCKELLQAAEESLEGPNYLCGIEACNEILDGNGPEIGVELRYECLCTRAGLLLKRMWKNDVHMAIRDCNKARSINTSSIRAHLFMSEALLQLGKHKEALDFAVAAQCLDPSDHEAASRVELLKEHFAEAEAEKSNKENDKVSKSRARRGKVRSEMNSDASQYVLRYQGEDFNYGDELELDFETSISGGEGRDNESSIRRGNLNLRLHRRGDSGQENCCPNNSCESPSSFRNDNTIYQAEVAIDMKQRYIGHCNVGTDIKQASFLGQRGEYVASGSDDGRWFIWEKRTGRLIKMLTGDEAVVNCVQCHPFDCTIATSGIDNTIKIWTPRAQVQCHPFDHTIATSGIDNTIKIRTPRAQIPSIVAEGAVGPESDDVLSAIEKNQDTLRHNHDVVLPLELVERLRTHEFSEETFHPIECNQT